MTDDELLNVARDSRHLTPAARNLLNGELLRRRITSGEVSKYENEQSNDSNDKKFTPEIAHSLWPAIGRIRDIGDWKQYRDGLSKKPLTYAGQLLLSLAHLAVVYILV